MVRPEGFEPPTSRVEAEFSILLKYGRICLVEETGQKGNVGCEKPFWPTTNSLEQDKNDVLNFFHD
jgi:hypothetical protein